jgi:hypothetical protein
MNHPIKHGMFDVPRGLSLALEGEGGGEGAATATNFFG